MVSHGNRYEDCIFCWLLNITSPILFIAYMKSNPQLSIRLPKATSIAFNRRKVGENSKIFSIYVNNLIQSTTSLEWKTLASKPPKLTHIKDKKAGGSDKLFWKRWTDDVVCCINPAGSFNLPTFIFGKRKKYQERECWILGRLVAQLMDLRDLLWMV